VCILANDKHFDDLFDSLFEKVLTKTVIVFENAIVDNTLASFRLS